MRSGYDKLAVVAKGQSPYLTVMTVKLLNVFEL